MDVNKKNTDVSKKNTDVSKKNTDVSKKNTDFSKKNTDFSKKNTDVSRVVFHPLVMCQNGTQYKFQKLSLSYHVSGVFNRTTAIYQIGI